MPHDDRSGQLLTMIDDNFISRRKGIVIVYDHQQKHFYSLINMFPPSLGSMSLWPPRIGSSGKIKAAEKEGACIAPQEMDCSS